MIEDRLLVHEQPVMTAVQLVDLGQPGILAQQIGQSAALKPLAVQPPFAARAPSEPFPKPTARASEPVPSY